MEFHKIVITGGPCGGKTTGLSYIEQGLTKYGYKVIFLNESATEIINSNLNYTAYNDNYLFEKNIIKLQLEKERLYEEACQALPNERVVLICDRGVMDCKSYTDQEDFDRILAELNTNEVELRDNYDAVFHLVTAAKGAEEFYTLANNSARRESLDEAVLADDRTMNCWIGHPHFRAIDNSTAFDQKMKRLLNEITAFLGVPEPFEIERKFLIKKPDIKTLENLPNCKKIEIVQTYLISPDKSEEVRVRQRGVDGHYIYTKTIKKKVSSIKRIETERKISEREYLKSLSNADTKLHQLTKNRYCIMHENRYFEVDIYPFSDEYAVCELELADENEEFIIPPFIEVVREVTGDETYSNKTLAKTQSLSTKKIAKNDSQSAQITLDHLIIEEPEVNMPTIIAKNPAPIKKRNR
ncbi:MAG: AAA family ATPase [Clostridia bacterium]